MFWTIRGQNFKPGDGDKTFLWVQINMYNVNVYTRYVIGLRLFEKKIVQYI